MKPLFISLFALLLMSASGRPAIVFTQGQSGASLTVHVVQRGENLSDIALKYNLSAAQIIEANGITDTSGIAVGQRLLIPLQIQTTAQRQRLTHTVVAGETLSSIAQVYDKTLEELSALNNLANSHQIFVGQELLIIPGEAGGLSASDRNDAEPTAAADVNSPPPQATPTDARDDEPPAAFFHTVTAGETLFEIGLRYNLTVTTMAQANNLPDPTRIYVGQRLMIPGIELPRFAQDLPEIIRAFSFNPQILAEGRTGRIEIATTEPVEISGQFLGQEFMSIRQNNGTQHHIRIGVPMFTEQEVYPLALNIVDAAGLSMPIDAYLQTVGGSYGHQNISINNNDLLTLAVENEEIELLASLTSEFNLGAGWTNSLGLPAAAPMNSVFGTRRSYNGSPYNRFHRGVDFAGATGTSVLAAAAGTVVLADTLNIRGNTTVIDHGWGLYTVYAHQNVLYVNPGDAVTSGQIIGAIGSTGRSTGPHLHWEVWLNGVNVDPMQWVQETFP